jgi:hypothetical protein
VVKTGRLLFSSLLYYKACLDMEQLCLKYDCGEPDVYGKRAGRIRESINILWDEDSGMFWAADLQCRQLDIWGSAYAIDAGITSRDQEKRIGEYFVKHYDEVLMKGQVRHLPGSDSHWEKLWHPADEGTYQNGAYWATPVAWTVPAIAKGDAELAKKTLEAVIRDFRENGIHECINEDYVKIPNFVVSATNVYGLTR